MRRILPVVIAAAILLIFGGFMHHRYSVALDDARGATKQAVAEAHFAVLKMDQAMGYAEQQKGAADTARKLAASAAERAKRFAERRTPLSVPPDTSCAPVVQALAVADSTSAAWSEAYAREHYAAEALTTALDSTVRAGQALVVATERVDTAATALVRASRPSFFLRLLVRLKPDVGVGAAIGIDPFTRRPSTTIGVTLSWKVL